MPVVTEDSAILPDASAAKPPCVETAPAEMLPDWASMPIVPIAEVAPTERFLPALSPIRLPDDSVPAVSVPEVASSAHNGSAQSVVTITMHDGAGQPLSGQRVSLGASAGFLSHVDVVTGTDGRAVFIVTAPALSVPAEDITVFATPFGTDAGAALTRILRIAFTGPSNTTAPQASFVFSPEAPIAGLSTAFDASATTDEGVQCVTCTFTWAFPTETASGMGAKYTLPTGQFPEGGTFNVTLTVRDSTGSETTLRRAVTWAPPAAEED